MEKPLQPASPAPASPSPTRLILTDEEFEKIDKDGLIMKWKELDRYVAYILEKSGDAVDEKLQLQQQESTRRENVLMMRLATKEQEMQELLTQVQELKQAQTPSATQLQTMLIDPAVNLLFEKMKTELTETKERLEQAQNDLSAWKFTPDSVTGKKLMGKCRTLIQENQELGKQLSQGRIAQLEAELSLQKKYSEELKGSQDEMNEFVIQLDEEVEGMQATICALQQQLKEAKIHSEKCEMENQRLRNRIDEISVSKQTNKNISKEPIVCESLEHRRSEIHSPGQDRSSKHDRTTLSINHDTLTLSNAHDYIMDIDKRDSTRNSESFNSDNNENLEVRHSANTVKVIRGSDENLKTMETQNCTYVSPGKGAAKTSFSINDLLSSGNECIKKEEDSPTRLPVEHSNGENGALNGVIDDSVV